MKVSRRNFSFYSLMGLLSYALPSRAEPFQPLATPYSGLFILQGGTDQSSTQISIMADKKIDVIAKAVLGTEVVQPVHVDIREESHSTWRITNVSFDGLKTDQIYQLKVTDIAGNILDERTFSLLDAQKPNYSFVTASCMNDFRHVDWIWKNLSQELPDVLFLLGDNVYGDAVTATDSKPADEVQLWTRYTQTRSTLELYRFSHLIPTFAIWDDHDTGKNNSNMTYDLIPYAREVFNWFFPCDQAAAVSEKGPGLSKWIKLFGQNFVLLDGRSFRSPPRSLQESYFGEEQEEWFFSRVKAGEKHWLMTGSEWFSEYRNNETFIVTHPQVFTQFMDRLKNSLGICVFCSGDVHFSEVCKVPASFLGYETFEFVSSGMHSSFVPGMDKFLPNKNRIFSKAFRNFMIFRGQTGTTHLESSLQVKSNDEKSAFDYFFSVGV